MKVKKLLSLLLALVMAFSLAVPALADEAEDETPVTPYAVPADVEGKLVILHTNDVHGAVDGYAKVAALKAQFEAAGANVLLVDAGDFSQGETYVSVSEGKTAVELMNQVGYDVAAPGNHEFDYGYENLKSLVELANFPVLAANVKYEGKVAFGDHVVVEKGGVKIGVFGLDTPETATKAHPAKIKGVTFDSGADLYAVAKAEVAALKAENCDVIVCLGHLGIDDESAANGNRSIDLLAKVEGIDLFIDGHSHSTLEEVMAVTGDTCKVNDTIITSTGTKIANVGAVIFEGDGTATVLNISADAIPVAEDDAVAARAKAIMDEIKALYGATFAKSSVALNGDRAPGNRTEETNLGDLITDAMLWYATKDGELDVPPANVVAITNGGGIRASIAAGDISRDDVNAVLPFGNTVATVYITGEALLEALEASTFCTPDAVGGFPQVAGITFEIDTSAAFAAGENYPGTTYAAPTAINRVTITSVYGADFDPDSTYAVVTNDFVAAGGDTYYTFSTSPKIVDTGVPLDEALIAYITEELDGVIGDTYANPQGRIVVKAYPGVDGSAWYAPAARTVIDRGLMSSTGNGFDPSAQVTCATVLQTLYNMEGRPNESQTDGAWYANAVAWAQENSLVGEFNEDGVILRGDIRNLLAAYGELKSVDYTNLMKGNENGDLMLDQPVDRAQYAQILVNLLAATPEPLV